MSTINKNIPKNLRDYGASLNIIKQAGNGAITSIQGLFLATNGLNEAQTKAFLIKNQLRLGTKSLNEIELRQVLITKGLTAEKAKLTAAEIVNTTTKKANVGASEAQMVANLGLIGSIKAMTIAIWANIKAIGIWLATTPAGWATLAAGAIIAVTSIMLNANKAYSEQIKKLKSVSGEYKQLTSDLKTAEEKLIDISRQISEINNKDTLTLTDQSDLERLRQENEELEIQISLLRMQAEAKNIEKNDVAIKSAKMFSQRYLEERPDYVDNSTVHDSIYDVYLERYNKLIARQDELNAMIASGTQLTKKEIKEFENLPGDITRQLGKLADFAIEANTIANEITGVDNVSVQWKNTLGDIVNYVNTLNKNPIQIKSEKLSEIMSSEEFENVVKRLEDINSKGELNSEVVKSYTEFNNAISKAGIAAEDVVNMLKDVPGSASEVTEAFKSFNDLIENLDKLQGMYEKLQKETNIDYKDVEWITDNYPSLLAYVGDEIQLRNNLKTVITAENHQAELLLRNKLFQQQEFAESYYNNNKTLFDNLGVVYDIDSKTFKFNQDKKLVDINGTIIQISSAFDIATSQLNGTYEADLNNFVRINQLKATDAIQNAAIAEAAWARVQQAEVDRRVMNAPFMTSSNQSGDSVYKGNDGNWYFKDDTGSSWITDHDIISLLESKSNIRIPTTYNPPKISSSGSSTGSDYDEKYPREYLAEVTKIENAIKRQNDLLAIQKESGAPLIEQQETLNRLNWFRPFNVNPEAQGCYYAKYIKQKLSA